MVKYGKLVSVGKYWKSQFFWSYLQLGEETNTSFPDNVNQQSPIFLQAEERETVGRQWHEWKKT